MTLSDLQQALDEGRYETARRMGIALLESGEGQRSHLLFALHDALVHLGDFKEATLLLEKENLSDGGHAFRKKMCLAIDYKKLTSESHYRISAEARQGLTLDEYQDKYNQLSRQYLDEAHSLAATEEEKATLEKLDQGQKPLLFSKQSVFTKAEPGTSSKGGSVYGRILKEDGTPFPKVEVTLGLEARVEKADPATFISHEMHYSPVIAPLAKHITWTDKSGNFVFHSLPAGTHEFIAVTLSPEKAGVNTRFIARAIKVENGKNTELGDLSVKNWVSAPPLHFASPHPESLNCEGVSWTKCGEWKLHNPFFHEFPRQLLLLPLDRRPGSYRICIESGQDEPFQIVNGKVALLTGLSAQQDKSIALYHSPTAGLEPPLPTKPVALRRDSPSCWTLETGAASFRIAGEEASVESAPLVSVRGPDGIWRGEGRLRFPEETRPVHRKTEVLVEGPLLIKMHISYQLNNGASWTLTLTALAGEPLLLVHEHSDAVEGAAFEFSLKEFSGGRGYLHWNAETGSRHWTSLQARDEVIGSLPESVPWWIPPQGFGYAMTMDGLEQQDYVGLFTRRRGEWIDRAFEKISHGPVDETGEENRELDWPYPEMVGSSISMINIHTSKEGDAFFRFPFFDGERHWGLFVSDFQNNDGPFKKLGLTQHAYSSPRLQEFMQWNLDVADSVQRPHVVVQKEQLPELRKKSQNPTFSGLWNKIRSQEVPGARDGILFAVEGDPLMAWYKRIQLLSIAEIRSKMTLLGRDFSDTYSPVGGRDITRWAEEYDLIAASGVFTANEERLIRAFFILMGHLYMEEDFMNWRFNSRNANFEADRTDIVASIGLVFQGHPDSSKFLDHAIAQTQRSLLAYCTPGSGKWYENPACYYLHAAKCRMNLVYHLAHKKLLDLESVPRLKDFLRWGLHLLTPPQPVSYQVMQGGDANTFESSVKIRKIPPLGDHAGIGRWLPEHYAFMGKLYLESDPELGQELINAYFCGNADGQRLLGLDSWENDSPESSPVYSHHGATFGNLPLFFSALDEKDIPPKPLLAPRSLRLEGFGAVLRNKVNTVEESCLLIKQGPGGYRYHRTEGSFLYFAQGKPLVFDGGEAGEAWRHSTLSFHEVHMPLSAGRVERYFDRQGFQFVQGVHPVILQPGDPVFLSDSCRHELVSEAWRRHRIAEPAAIRSFLWVDDDYLVIHDDLRTSRPALSHWNLQVVGKQVLTSKSNHFHFEGRFGIDLEVILPNQEFEKQACRKLPMIFHQGKREEWFSMQHLQLSKTNATHFLAVLLPTKTGTKNPLSIQALQSGDSSMGLHVKGETREDFLWFDRKGATWENRDIRFQGFYGALLQDTTDTRLVLAAAGTIQRGTLCLHSAGPKAILTEFQDGTFRLEAENKGLIIITTKSNRFEINVSDSSTVTLNLKSSLEIDKHCSYLL